MQPSKRKRGSIEERKYEELKQNISEEREKEVAPRHELSIKLMFSR